MSMTDVMFYEACLEAAKYSRCLSRQIGVVIVDPKTNIIQAMGYNGPPASIPACNIGWYKDMIGQEIAGCPRQDMGYGKGEGLDKCIAVHAERSAIVHAAGRGVAIARCHMYMTCGVPCKDCMVEIIEAGISELVVREIYEDSHDYYDLQSEYLSKKTLMKIRKWELDA